MVHKKIIFEHLPNVKPVYVTCPDATEDELKKYGFRMSVANVRLPRLIHVADTPHLQIVNPKCEWLWKTFWDLDVETTDQMQELSQIFH